MQDAEAGAFTSHRRFRETPWKHDARSRRFKTHATFGTPSLASLPKTLARDPGPLLDQGTSLRCTGYGNAFEGFLIHGVPMNPDWSAAKVGQKQGQTVDVNGGDPNACMKSMCDDGFLPITAEGKIWQTTSYNTTGMTMWDAKLDAVARVYDRAIAFFKVTGPYDAFDNIWANICEAYTEGHQGVDAFGTWYHEWSAAPRGIIPENYSQFAGYHRYVFFDKKKIGNREYLVAKGSYGPLGDTGLYYFSREVVNREFAKWGTTLKILKTLTPEQLAEAKKTTPLGRLWEAVIQAWYALSEKYGSYLHLYA